MYNFIEWLNYSIFLLTVEILLVRLISGLTSSPLKYIFLIMAVQMASAAVVYTYRECASPKPPVYWHILKQSGFSKSKRREVWILRRKQSH